MRQMKLSVESLTVETFEPGPGGSLSPESTTVDVSLMWCGTTGGPLYCLVECSGGCRSEPC